MRIRRVEIPKGWTSIPNGSIEDTTLSFRALGVLTYLLSRPADWETDSERLAATRREGRDAVRRGLRELEAARYLFRIRQQGARGRWSTYHLLFDEPLPEGIDPVTLAPPLIDVDDAGDPIPPVDDAVENPGDQIHRNADRRLENRPSVNPALITTQENHYEEGPTQPPTSEPVEKSPARRPPGSGRASRSDADAAGGGAFTPASSSRTAALAARLGMAPLRDALEAALKRDVGFETALWLLDVEARSAAVLGDVTIEDVVRSGLAAAASPGGLAAAGAGLAAGGLWTVGGTGSGRARPVPGVGSSRG